MDVWEKRGQENGPKAEKDKTGRATGLGRRTKEKILKSGIKLTEFSSHPSAVNVQNVHPVIHILVQKYT